MCQTICSLCLRLFVCSAIIPSFCVPNSLGCEWYTWFEVTKCFFPLVLEVQFFCLPPLSYNYSWSIFVGHHNALRRHPRPMGIWVVGFKWFLRHPQVQIGPRFIHLPTRKFSLKQLRIQRRGFAVTPMQPHFWFWRVRGCLSSERETNRNPIVEKHLAATCDFVPFD